MLRGQAKRFLSVLLCFVMFFTNGNASFGDYMKKKFNKVNSTISKAFTDSTKTTKVINSNNQRENFVIHEVRPDNKNIKGVFKDREKKMLESLFSGKTMEHGKPFNLGHEIIGREMESKLDTLFQHTSPCWEQLDELLDKAEKITRLPQSMYYDGSADSKLEKLRPDLITNVKQAGENIFEKKLQKLNQIDYGEKFRKQQIYSDVSLSEEILRRKRETEYFTFTEKFHLNNKLETNTIHDQINPRETAEDSFPRVHRNSPTINDFYMDMSDLIATIHPYKITLFKLTRNYKALNLNNRKKVEESNLKNSRLLITPVTSKFPEESKTVKYTGKPCIKRLFQNQSTHISETYNAKISQSFRQTPYATLDSTWRELVKNLNPIQQKKIFDLFIYGPPSTINFNLETIQKSYVTMNSVEKSRVENLLFCSTRLVSRITTRNYFQNGVEKLHVSDPSTAIDTNGISQTSMKMDHSMKQSMKPFNSENQKDIENLFLYDALLRDTTGKFTRSMTETGYNRQNHNFTSMKGSNKFNVDLSSGDNALWKLMADINAQYNDDDLSKLAKEASPVKLKIIDDWCDEITRDLRRKFPTKKGETKDLGPFPPTRYYPWELFSMVPKNR